MVGPGGSVQQVTNYYPFGAPYADPSAVTGAYLQPYKYNFSIKREKRKLACFSEREKNRPKVNGKEFDGIAEDMRVGREHVMLRKIVPRQESMVALLLV